MLLHFVRHIWQSCVFANFSLDFILINQENELPLPWRSTDNSSTISSTAKLSLYWWIFVSSSDSENVSIHPYNHDREYNSKPIKDMPISFHHMGYVLHTQAEIFVNMLVELVKVRFRAFFFPKSINWTRKDIIGNNKHLGELWLNPPVKRLRER